MLGIRRKIKLLISVNWIKTLYFNFKMFPFKVARKIPVFFYENVKFSSLSGQVVLKSEIKTGMIGFGQPYEMTSRSRGISEIYLSGKLVLKGHVQFGKDYFIYIQENAYCEMGHMSSMASLAKLICTNKVILGNWARIGAESQIIDTTFHQMKNTVNNNLYPKSTLIKIGDYNYIGNRVSIMPKTITNNFCTIASNSLCNKNYSDLEENVLIGGIPAKLLKTKISRDWKGEEENMKKHLIINF